MLSQLDLNNISIFDYQLSSSILQLAIAIGIFLVFYLFQKIFLKKFFEILVGLLRKQKFKDNDPFVLAFEKPIRRLFVLMGIYFALSYLPLTTQQQGMNLKLFRSFLILVLANGLFNLTGNYVLIGSWLKRLFGIEFEQILYPFVSKTLKVILGALAVSIIAGEWDYDINGFVAGLGLGGLAFVLAAKDTVANIFGGIVIATDKPFTIGDWIQTPTIEGTVEDINFRSTRVRTFAQALITIPNSTLANEPITNWSLMGKRRINFKLILPYSTTRQKLNNMVTNIREMLENHPEISQETIFVRLDSFEKNGYGIFLYFFTKTIIWGEFLRIKEDVNYRIIKIMEAEGVTIAIPNTRIYTDEKSSFSEPGLMD